MRLALTATVLTLVVTSAGSAPAREFETTCHVDRLVNHVLAPVDLLLGDVPTGTLAARVSIDEDAGRFALDGGSFDIPPYPMAFSTGLDTLDFADRQFEGVIDAAGTVVVPDVHFVICTLDAEAGEPCVPRNVCDHDQATICIRGAQQTGCPPGVGCRGVCAGDRSRSCTTDDDCALGDRCGAGTLVPFTATLSTGTLAYQGRLKSGTPLSFQTGQLFLTSIGPTPLEAPIIQNSGQTSLELTCTLGEIPDPNALPAPATMTVKKATLKLGPGGEGAGDDALKLKATYAGPLPDLESTDVILGFSTRQRVCDGNSTEPGAACVQDGDCVLSDDSPAGEAKCEIQDRTFVELEVPAGTLRGNRKGTKFKARDKRGTCSDDSESPGAACVSGAECVGGGCVRSIKALRPLQLPAYRPTHTVAIKRSKGGSLQVTLTSKGVDLDSPTMSTLAGGTVPEVTTRMSFGALVSAGATTAPKATKKGVTF
jgi:hypothetical protein